MAKELGHARIARSLPCREMWRSLLHCAKPRTARKDRGGKPMANTHRQAWVKRLDSIGLAFL